MITQISKGRQVTIPAKFRSKYGFEPGSNINIQDTGKGVLLAPIAKVDWNEIAKEGQKYPNNLTDKEMDALEDQIYE